MPPARAHTAAADAKPASRWRRTLGSRVLAQTALYSGASGLAMLLGGLARAILARDLDPSAFGSFAFATSFLMLAALLFDFGVFNSAARRLARAPESQRSELIGASYAAFVPVGAMFGAAVFATSFVVDDIFHTDAGSALRVISPAAFVYSFTLLGEQIAKGADRLHVFSISHLIGRVALVGTLLGAAVAGLDFTVTSALVINSASLLLAVVLFGLWLRPSFARTAEQVRRFIADTRDWAFQIYVGRVFSIGTYNMDVLMVAAFSNPEETGFYALAAALAGIMGLPMVGLGAALFPRMAHAREVDQRWVAAAWSVGLGGALALWLTGPPLIDLVFGDDYSPVSNLLLPLVLAQAVRGTTTIYNTFLSAQARGKEMRNAAFVLTASNLVLNFALIPPFGAKGAAWASLLALLANFAAYLYYYGRYRREMRGAGA